MKRQTRRLGRILFNTLTAISLLLALATAGLWFRSYWSPFILDCSVRWGHVEYDGEEIPTFKDLDIGFIDGAFGLSGREEFRRAETELTVAGTVQRNTFPSFSFWSNGPDFEVIFPGWILALLAAIQPVTRWILWKRQPAPPGHCPACGYDTRANPAKCSECGHDMPVTTEVESE